MKTYPTNAERKAAKAAKAAAQPRIKIERTTAEERAAMTFEGPSEYVEMTPQERVANQEYFEQQLQNQKNTIR